MLFFPNAKVNLGLNIIRKRDDGFHEIETIFYPIALHDRLEIDESDTTRLELSGIKIEGTNHDNLVIRAYHMLCRDFDLPPVRIALEKKIPAGAGLGGGSSDGAFMLLGLNNLFKFGLSNEKLKSYAGRLGSDCAFFIDNRPVRASGRGEILKPVSLSLKGYYLVVVKPDFPVSTGEAYAGVVPRVPAIDMEEAIQADKTEWRGSIVNQFEETIFPKYPMISEIKEKLYQSGAIYAAMSGSGSAVFGLFKQLPAQIEERFPGLFVHSELCRV